MWPPNSSDLNPVNYAIWSVIQPCVYKTRVHDIDELRQRSHRAARSSRWLMMQLTNGQHACVLVFVPEMDILDIFVTTCINLFSLYLKNFMFHTMLDTAGDVLRVYYDSTKCDVLFSQRSVSKILRWGKIFHTCVKHFVLFTTVQNYNNRSRFSRVTCMII